MQVHYSDPLQLTVPYEYIAMRQIKPPDGFLYDAIAFIALTLTFLFSVANHKGL